ncbi:MAG: S-layer homology domain-containing protein [Clostridia bacterium]|nr:S-layer homology domain-containing protein [Clostridia bacterium]
MKKIIMLLTAAAAFGIFSAVCFAADAVYDAQSGLLGISGKGDADSFVTVTVYKDGSAPTVSAADENVIYKTVQADENGFYNIELSLPEFYKNGRYAAETSGGTANEKFYIGFVGEAVSASEVNSASDEAQLASALAAFCSELGIDSERYESYRQEAAKSVFKRRPPEGYNTYSLAEVYYFSEGAASFLKGDITLDEFLMLYTAYTGVKYSEYSGLDSEVKSILSSVMKNVLASDFGSFSELYNESRTVAWLRSCKSFVQLKQRFPDAAAEYGISLSEYEGLGNEYYRDEAFKSFYETVNSANTMEDMKELFDDAVDKAREKQKASNDKTTGSGGGSGGSGGGGGTGASASGAFVSGVLPELSGEVQTQSAAFPDIASHWAREYITSLYKEGIIDGFEDGSFRPDGQVTRAQLTKMLLGAMKLEPEGESPFADVPADAWYCGYIAAASKNGIVTGISETEFLPDSFVTRQDAAVMIYRAAAPKAASGAEYSDFNEVSDYAKAAVSSLSACGVVSGFEGRFNPLGLLTRAEAAAMLQRAAKYFSERRSA